MQGPWSRTNEAGTEATFTAVAVSAQPLNYQWFGDGTNRLEDTDKVSGTRSATLTIRDTLGGDAGSYTVVVASALGSVTSTPPAILTVVDPIIASQPEDQTNLPGSTAWFSVGVHGTSLHYAWFKDGAAISGATNETLRLAGISAADAAGYSVVVSNTYGKVTSRAARLVVIPEPVLRSVRFTEGLAVITWSSVAGQTYRLRYRDGFASAIWYDLLPEIIATGPITSATNVLDGATQRFYQVILAPEPTPPLAIRSIHAANGCVVITWNSVSGQKYRLLYKNTLRDKTWLVALPDITASGPTTTVTNALGGATQRFYRVMLAPSEVPPFVITSIHVAGGAAVVTWNSDGGQTYRLQYKDHLNDPTWQDAAPDVLAIAPTTTVTNLLGSATQRFYRVTLLPGRGRPLIQSITRTNGVVRVVWSSVLSQAYRLQYKGTLNDPDWNNVVPDVTATGPTTYLTDAVGDSTQRYYRVTLMP
jgi:hypothetical protein